ncbi:MAG: permease prefix domain 1-containing protein [Candidatus Nanopelagicales bacterium]|nr:permease prefix domain 1-containing protein [Candidatus Nanopelagicales bacterium]
MADHDLIEAYLAELRGTLAWRRDDDELVDEISDHLHEAAERLLSNGTEHRAAQEQSLAQFGDPVVVARAFATTSSGGIAMPTQFTRTAGSTALIAAAFWALMALTGFVGGTELIFDGQLAPYVLWAVVSGIAGILSVVSLAGLLVRCGGLRGAVPAAALAVATIGAVMLGITTWAWVVWTALLAIATGLTVWRMHTSGTRREPGDWVAVAAWPIGIAVFVLLTQIGLGPVDYYGDYPVANAAGLTVGALLFAVGLGRLGRWLRSEEPVEASSPMAST